MRHILIVPYLLSIFLFLPAASGYLIITGTTVHPGETAAYPNISADIVMEVHYENIGPSTEMAVFCEPEMGEAIVEPHTATLGPTRNEMTATFTIHYWIGFHPNSTTDEITVYYDLDPGPDGNALAQLGIVLGGWNEGEPEPGDESLAPPPAQRPDPIGALAVLIVPAACILAYIGFKRARPPKFRQNV